ncbi:hypothetical protein LCGC14_2341570 [marine sediment metagenome]|uniref:Uncharacterized protein n=1 Tax=marine sediment metagenome TaxID=412755 RepID=A0A0F9CBT6_9ZZZZ
MTEETKENKKEEKKVIQPTNNQGRLEANLVEPYGHQHSMDSP